MDRRLVVEGRNQHSVQSPAQGVQFAVVHLYLFASVDNISVALIHLSLKIRKKRGKRLRVLFCSVFAYLLLVQTVKNRRANAHGPRKRGVSKLLVRT